MAPETEGSLGPKGKATNGWLVGLELVFGAQEIWTIYSRSVAAGLDEEEEEQPRCCTIWGHESCFEGNGCTYLRA